MGICTIYMSFIHLPFGLGNIQCFLSVMLVFVSSIPVVPHSACELFLASPFMLFMSPGCD